MKISILIDNHLDRDIVSWDLEDFSVEDCSALIDEVKPTRLTVFAVGHDGWAQYPSAIAKPAPGLKYDMPEIWRKIARERGIDFALYVSTLRNDILVQGRGDWERIRADGFRTGRIDHTSKFAEHWLHPLIQELVERYDPDGFFFDGDYWAVGEGIGPNRQLAAKRWLGLDTPLEQAPVSAQRSLTTASYDHYLNSLGRFLASQARPLLCSVNLAYTFRHPIPPADGLSLITSDLPPFFGPLDAWIETGVVKDKGQAREVVVPLFVEPEGGGRKYPKHPAQLIHEVAPLLAADEAVHVYFPMTRKGRIDRSYVAALNAMRSEIETQQTKTPLQDVSFEPDVLCLADSEVLPGSQDFTALRGAMLACSVAGLNVGVASTSRCETRLDSIRMLILPAGKAESLSAQALVDLARHKGVVVLGDEVTGFASLMNQSNWSVSQSLVDLLRSGYETARNATIWSGMTLEHHWSVLVRGCVAADGQWRLFFWNSIERGSSLGKHVLNDGAGYGGRVQVSVPSDLRITRVWGFSDSTRVSSCSADFNLNGAFAVVEGSLQAP